MSPAEEFLVDLWKDVEAGKRVNSNPHSFIFGARTLLAFQGQACGEEYNLLSDALSVVLSRQYGSDHDDLFYRGVK